MWCGNDSIHFKSSIRCLSSNQWDDDGCWDYPAKSPSTLKLIKKPRAIKKYNRKLINNNESLIFYSKSKFIFIVDFIGPFTGMWAWPPNLLLLFLLLLLLLMMMMRLMIWSFKWDFFLGRRIWSIFIKILLIESYLS